VNLSMPIEVECTAEATDLAQNDVAVILQRE
jgi:hypothetical protein